MPSSCGFGFLDFLSIVCYVIPLIAFVYLAVTKNYYIMSKIKSEKQTAIEVADNFASDSQGMWIIGIICGTLVSGLSSRLFKLFITPEY